MWMSEVLVCITEGCMTLYVVSFNADIQSGMDSVSHMSWVYDICNEIRQDP